MFAGYMAKRVRQEAWEAYTAQMLWHLNTAAHRMLGVKFEQPTWLDMINPKPRDERTGRQIVNDLVAKLRARQEKRMQGRRGP